MRKLIFIFWMGISFSITVSASEGVNKQQPNKLDSHSDRILELPITKALQWNLFNGDLVMHKGPKLTGWNGFLLAEN